MKIFKASGGPPVTSAPYIFHYIQWLGLLLSSFMECDRRCCMSHIPVYAKFTFYIYLHSYAQKQIFTI